MEKVCVDNVSALNAGVSAVYRDGRACDEAGILAAEEGDDGGNLEVLADAVHGVDFAVFCLFLLSSFISSIIT